MKNEKLIQILVEYSDALGFNHTKLQNEAYKKCLNAIEGLLEKAGRVGINVGVEVSDVYNSLKCEPNLGCATTKELLTEISARLSEEQLNYKTVDDR